MEALRRVPFNMPNALLGLLAAWPLLGPAAPTTPGSPALTPLSPPAPLGREYDLPASFTDRRTLSRFFSNAGRNVVGLTDAHSSEFNKNTPHPVICLLDEQKSITDKGGTMRLGKQEAALESGSEAANCYGAETVYERHRHRYEFNNAYRQQFVANGMLFSGLSPDGSLVEIIEIPSHPWFCAVQYHPEFSLLDLAAVMLRYGPVLWKEGFFPDEASAMAFVEDLKAVHADPPGRWDLAWRYGFGREITDPMLRQNEITNWIEHYVQPTRSARGRG